MSKMLILVKIISVKKSVNILTSSSSSFLGNYNCFFIIQVKTDDGEIVILNVCRSLVHTNQSHCPYQAAACLQHPGIIEAVLFFA